MTAEHYCLGLPELGLCAENIESLFSIGDAVAFVAIFLAFYQLSDLRTWMRRSTRWLPERYLFSILRCGVYLVFLAAGLRALGHSSIPVIGYPIIWEIVAGLILVFSGLLLTTWTFKPTRISKRTAASFLRCNQIIITTGQEDDLRKLGDEIRYSLSTIAKQCVAYNQAPGQDRADATPPVDEFTRVCFTLLDAWSDPRFCKALMCWCPGTAIEIFKTLSEHRALDSAYALGTELVHQAFSDTSSIVHREGGYSALGRHKLFLKTVYGDLAILRSCLNPLDSWHTHIDKDITRNKIERWGDAIDIALRTCIEKHDTFGNAHVIRQGLNTLNGACVFLLADRERKQSPGWGDAQSTIHAIDTVFEHVIELVTGIAEDIPEKTTIDSYVERNDRSLHGDVARKLYDFYGKVSTSTDHDFLHHSTIQSWMMLFPIDKDEMTESLRALQIRVLHHMKKKIDHNFNRDGHYYPAITKLLIVHYGIGAPPQQQQATSCELEHWLGTYFHSELKAKFHIMWKKDQKFAGDLLPDDTEFDEANVTLRRTRLLGRIEELKVEQARTD